MPISDYLRNIRAKVGHDLLVLPSVTIIVRDDKKRILLTRNADVKSWVLPGGSVEPDESPNDAAVREMREETGLIVEPVRVIGSYGGPEFRIVYPNGDIVSYVMTAFECEFISGELTPDLEETLEIQYFSKAEVDFVQTLPWVRIVMQDVFNQF